MQTKLTLRLDDSLVQKAKTHARRNGTSVSRMIADYFQFIQGGHEIRRIRSAPLTSSLQGLLRQSSLDEKEYKKFLEGKYL
jgi:hypothetical protein